MSMAKYMKKKQLQEYVVLLESALDAVSPVRNEAMLRSGDSPNAEAAIRRFDAANLARLEYVTKIPV